MLLEAHLIRATKDVARTTVSLRLADNHFELLDSVFWTEDNCVPSHIYYDIHGRKPAPIRIDPKPGSTPAGPPPPLQRLLRNLDLETRMYVLSDGTGQRITLPGANKAPVSPAVKPLRPDIKKD